MITKTAELQELPFTVTVGKHLLFMVLLSTTITGVIKLLKSWLLFWSLKTLFVLWPLCKDLLALGHGDLDLRNHKPGLICCWSLKNPTVQYLYIFAFYFLSVTILQCIYLLPPTIWLHEYYQLLLMNNNNIHIYEFLCWSALGKDINSRLFQTGKL